MRQGNPVLPDTGAMQKQLHDLVQAMSQALQFGSLYSGRALARPAEQGRLLTKIPRCMAHD